MKTLLLLRHAKSSWKDESLDDHDRPLKGRGIKAARRMGSLIRKEGLSPDQIVCSTAVRARETLKLVLEEFRSRPSVEFTERLYHCAPGEFGAVLREAELSDCVMLVGHNPGMEEFLAELSGQHEAFPTAALAQVELDLDDWSAFSDATSARVVQIWRPREMDLD